MSGQLLVLDAGVVDLDGGGVVPGEEGQGVDGVLAHVAQHEHLVAAARGELQLEVAGLVVGEEEFDDLRGIKNEVRREIENQVFNRFGNHRASSSEGSLAHHKEVLLVQQTYKLEEKGEIFGFEYFYQINY